MQCLTACSFATLFLEQIKLFPPLRICAIETLKDAGYVCAIWLVCLEGS